MHARPKVKRVAFSLTLLAAFGTLVVSAAQAEREGVGALQIQGLFRTNFIGAECPAGTPTTTHCYRQVSAGEREVGGLGRVTAEYTLVYDDFGSSCTHVHAQIPIVVAGKGEIDLAVRSSVCITPTLTGPNATPQVPPTEFTITGGSGRYAGASGSGAMLYHTQETSPGKGWNDITWTGTLDVPGLGFDTTPPQITGAKPKKAKTRSVAGARVRYSVSATDETDGPVTVTCAPKSGSRFRVGRTTVKCGSVDGSGNTATARFVVTVQHMPR